jgi:hypothetical protein
MLQSGESVGVGTATRAVPWRAVMAAALLSLLLGVVLSQGLAGQLFHTSRTVRFHPTLSRPAPHMSLSTLPLAAQGIVSEALGVDDRAYRIHAAESGLRAVNPKQHLSLRFDRSGASVGSGTTHLGLSVHAVGYGTSLKPLGQVAPSLRGHRVVYARAGVSEWYANGPLGLEQGFTIAQSAGSHPTGPLTLAMTLSGDVHASLATGGQSVTLSRPKGSSLRYGGLVAHDAQGRTLRSWLAVRAGRVLLHVDTHGARYPVRIDPWIQQGPKLTGSEEIENSQFGISVALSASGNTALIGGREDHSGIGAAWVFTRSNGQWTQQGPKLTGSGEIGDGNFGASVALSSSGNTAIIGGGADNGGHGALWVFTRAGNTWTQQGSKLTASEGGVLEVGSSVALSSDGNTALTDGNNATNSEAFVFKRSGETWTQSAAFTASESVKGFGKVALSSEATTALIGESSASHNIGAAWVFTHTEGKWSQQGSKLTAKGESGEALFGASVALSAEGSTSIDRGAT